MSFQKGDIAKITSGQKYLRGLEVVIVDILPVNVKCQLLRPELGRRFGEGPFYANPLGLKFVRKGDGKIPSPVVAGVKPVFPGGGDDGDEGEDDFDTQTSGNTMRDFKNGDKVRTASWMRPSYIANQTGVIVKKRRTRILVKFDNPPIGTRFERGVVAKPERLFKV